MSFDWKPGVKYQFSRQEAGDKYAVFVGRNPVATDRPLIFADQYGALRSRREDGTYGYGRPDNHADILPVEYREPVVKEGVVSMWRASFMNNDEEYILRNFIALYEREGEMRSVGRSSERRIKEVYYHKNFIVVHMLNGEVYRVWASELT